MRKMMFASVVAALALAASAAAEERDDLAKVKVTPAQVTFTIENPSPFVMTCTGQLVGTTKKGKRLVARMDKEQIQPGGYGALALESKTPKKDPFVEGWSDMACDAPAPDTDP